jgi:hypothetical protein
MHREPNDLYPLFPSPVVAEALLDRLLNSAHIITMLGRSYRPQQRPTDLDGGTKKLPQRASAGGGKFG